MYISGSKLELYGERFESRKPITAEIFLTDFCDKGCGFCRYTEGSNFIPFEKFKKIVEKLQSIGVKGFNLTGGGEPLLNPDIKKILSWLDDKKIPYGINTYLPFIPKNRPKWIKINDNFDEVQPEDIKDIPKSVVVGAQIVIDCENPDIKKFYKKWENSRVDYMVVRPIESVEKAHTVEEAGKIINTIKEIGDPRLQYNYKWHHVQDPRANECKANWSVITVNTDGEVIYCCHKPDEIVGSIFDPEIKKKKIVFKSDMSKCEVPCRMTGNNKVYDKVKKRVENHSEFL